MLNTVHLKNIFFYFYLSCLLFNYYILYFFFYVELKTLNVSQLNEVYMELELLIRDYSETLITELALRDELEFEKELKNSFISLLLAVQNRRRQYHVEKKRNSRAGNTNKNLTNEPKVCCNSYTCYLYFILLFVSGDIVIVSNYRHTVSVGQRAFK